MFNKSLFFSLMIILIGTFNLVFFAGYIAIQLVDLDLSENNVGYVLALQNITYLPMCFVFPRIFNKLLPRKLQFVIAMLGFSVTCLLLGPSEFMSFNKYEKSS